MATYQEMKRFLALGSLAVILMTNPSIAFTLIGAGAKSCGSWTTARRYGHNTERSVPFDQWMVGFLSGVGYAGQQNPLNNMDADGVLAWVDNYCATYPINDVLTAGMAFIAAHPH
jgi:hypothetical protein